MKNKIFNKIWDRFLIILVVFSLWVLLMAIFPNYPAKFTESYNLCDTSNLSSWVRQSDVLFKNVSSPTGENTLQVTSQRYINSLMFSCDIKIPIDILFRAKKIYVDVYSSQEADMTIFLHRRGFGPFLAPKRIFPKLIANGNLTILDLDDIHRPKINWLIGDYDEITFEINNFQPLDNITINIKKVYLQ